MRIVVCPRAYRLHIRVFCLITASIYLAFFGRSNGAELHLASSKVKTAGRHHIVFTPKQRPKPQTESQTLFTEHLSLEGSTARAVDQLGKTPGTRVREKSKEEAEKVGESLSDDIFDKMTREEHQGEGSVPQRHKNDPQRFDSGSGVEAKMQRIASEALPDAEDTMAYMLKAFEKEEFHGGAKLDRYPVGSVVQVVADDEDDPDLAELNSEFGFIEGHQPENRYLVKFPQRQGEVVEIGNDYLVPVNDEYQLPPELPAPQEGHIIPNEEHDMRAAPQQMDAYKNKGDEAIMGQQAKDLEYQERYQQGEDELGDAGEDQGDEAPDQGGSQGAEEREEIMESGADLEHLKGEDAFQAAVEGEIDQDDMELTGPDFSQYPELEAQLQAQEYGGEYGEEEDKAQTATTAEEYSKIMKRKLDQTTREKLHAKGLDEWMTDDSIHFDYESATVQNLIDFIAKENPNFKPSQPPPGPLPQPPDSNIPNANPHQSSTTSKPPEFCITTRMTGPNPPPGNIARRPLLAASGGSSSLLRNVGWSQASRTIDGFIPPKRMKATVSASVSVSQSRRNAPTQKRYESAEMKLADGWVKLRDESGKAYYMHAATGLVSHNRVIASGDKSINSKPNPRWTNTEFLASSEFIGRRRGYVFTTAEKGLGYYSEAYLLRRREQDDDKHMLPSIFASTKEEAQRIRENDPMDISNWSNAPKGGFSAGWGRSATDKNYRKSIRGSYGKRVVRMDIIDAMYKDPTKSNDPGELSALRAGPITNAKTREAMLYRRYLFSPVNDDEMVRLHENAMARYSDMMGLKAKAEMLRRSRPPKLKPPSRPPPRGGGRDEMRVAELIAGMDTSDVRRNPVPKTSKRQPQLPPKKTLDEEIEELMGG